MNHLRSLALLGLLAASIARASAEENVWPVRVAQTDAHGETISWQAAGPLIFQKPSAEPGTVAGVRPFFAQWRSPTGALRETNALYPLFTYRTDSEAYRWSFFQLINRSGPAAGQTSAQPASVANKTFDIWPFWFSRDTGTSTSSYQALFPVAGSIQSRFGYDRLSWIVFPLYGRAERKGTVSTSAPWPFVKVTRGAEQGFALWPLFGHREKPGAFEQNFFLWPLAWNNTLQPPEDAPAGAQAHREHGFLPFYTSETEAGFVNRNYLWPFFGYTERTAPVRYHENRYLWPFLVQGRGEQKHVNRWGPFYTHSTTKGTDKTWVLWPLYRQKSWTDAGLHQTQRQLLYCVYRSTRQRSVANPQAAPAEKAHLWPLVSAWDNGAGRKQVQFPSPLEVFFSENERVRVSWSPLFALYRFDQRSPEAQRHELLWGLISWNREPEHREFHLGPLFSVNARAGEKRIALGNGLVGWQRTGADGGRFFWFDFPRRADKLRASAH